MAIEHEAIKPVASGFLVYANKKLLTLTPVSRSDGRRFVEKLRDLCPMMNVELIGIHTMESSSVKETCQ